jgi:hypothetical protein
MKFNAARSSNLLLVMLIIFTALSTQAQHYLYGTPFLQNRTALLFIVLFNCSYMLLYQFVSDHQSKYRMAMHTLFLIYPVFLAVMFVYNLRPHYYFDWKYDCSTKEMLTDLKNDSDLHSTDQKISLGISWLFEPGIKYYMNTRQLDWMKPANREGYDGTFDYYYIMDDRAFIENRKLTVVKDYRDSNSTLARRPEK